jgi:hypothetical protein
MTDSITPQEKFGELLRTNKFAIFLEIAVVVIPLYAGLMISDRLGSDVVPFGGNCCASWWSSWLLRPGIQSSGRLGCVKDARR